MKQPSATLIGFFVVGALALIAAGILFFGRGMLFKQHIAAFSYFQGSVAGLQIGAAVTYRGVRVGEVKSIGIRLDPDTTRSLIRVDMELVPDAVKVYGTKLGGRDVIPALVEQGLSARLVMQSFVTHQLQVELDFRPGVQTSRVGEQSEVPEIPTVPSPFAALTEQLETLDIASAITTLQHTLGSLDALLSSPSMKQTIAELPALLADLRHTVKTIDHEVHGFSSAGQRSITESAAAIQKTLASVQSLTQNFEREATDTLKVARGTLQNANTAIDGANVLLDPDGPTITNVERAVEDLAATAARLRDVSERVDRDPSVLIRGRR